MADKIQVRRDTAANWTTNNPVLAAGEPGFESDTGKFKIGNGTSDYSTLTSIGGSSGGASGYDDILNAININRGISSEASYLQSGFADGFQTTTGIGSTSASFAYSSSNKNYANYTSDNYIMRFNGDMTNLGLSTLTSVPTTYMSGAAITYSTTAKKFGSHSIRLNGSPIQFASTNNISNVGSGDFTIQMWFFIESTGQFILATTDNIDPSYGYALYVTPAGNINYSYGNTGYTNETILPTKVVSNTWTHFALCRSNGVCRLYINGVGVSAVNLNFTWGGLLLGGCYYRGGPYGNQMVGYIDDLCINKTTATYTSNFTPPAMEAGNTASATGSITSIPLTAQSVPNTAKIISSVNVQTTGGAVPANFSIEGSRDNGVTWSNASAVTVAPKNINGTTSMVYGDVDLSGQPSGTQVKYRIGYKNSITANFYGAGVTWS